MEITVTGRHIEVTDAIRQYALDKAGKLPRYFDRVTEIDVIADKRENHSYEVEFITHVEHHDVFVARAKDEDLYACIDEAADKMARQLSEHKEKIRNRKHSANH